MQKKIFIAGLSVAVLLLFPSMASAHAKEGPGDGGIPLTSEYFPDEWFLESKAKLRDKNKDGFLSPEEIAAVTAMWCTQDLSDFSQLQYFTNLRKLTVEPGDENSKYGVWVGSDLDLTVFPNLEKAVLTLDSRKAPADAADMCIRVSGMKQLKFLRVSDKSPENGPGGARIETIDLSGTPLLETVYITNAEGVAFGEDSSIRKLYLNNIRELPNERLGSLTALESLNVRNTVSGFKRLDLSKNPALKEIEVYGSSLEEVGFAGATALESANIGSDHLRVADVSGNKNLRYLKLACQELEQLSFAGADSLRYLSIESGRLAGIDVETNQTLEGLTLNCPEFTELNVGDNPGLKYLDVVCAQLDSLDVGNNVQLEELSVTCDRIGTLDVSRNTGLTSLEVCAGNIRELDLAHNRKLEKLTVCCRKLAGLDLSACKKIRELSVRDTALKALDASGLTRLEKLELDGMKKLKRVKMDKSKKLRYLYVKNTAIKSLDLSNLGNLYMVEITGNKNLTKLAHLESRRLLYLEVTGNKRLAGLDLRKSTHLLDIDVRDNALKTLELSGLEPQYIYCQKNRLKVLDLTGAETAFLCEVWCDKGVKVKGYKGKVKKV